MPSFKNKLTAALGLGSLAAPLAAAKQSSVSLLRAGKGALGGPTIAAVTMADVSPLRAASVGAMGAVGVAGAMGAAAIGVASSEATREYNALEADKAAQGNVLLGKGKSMRKQTSRRIMRAMGELSL